MTRHIHVVGAGIAGLAAAVRLSERSDVRITLWEATQRAGGRCWSFHDAKLDRQIDNGNHLVLSGNAAVLDYARRIGSEDLLNIAPDASFPFFDRQDGRRWTVTIPRGLSDVFRGSANLPGPQPAAGLDALRLLAAGRRRTVAEAIPGRGPLWHRLWVPLTFAVLNEPPERGSAQLLAAVLRRTLLRGNGACRPVFVPQGLGATFVDPAVRLLRRRGVTLNWRSRLASLRRGTRGAESLSFHDGGRVELGEGDAVILAAAPACAAAFPDHPRPRPGLTIVNAHFRVPQDTAEKMPPLLGITSGAAHWVFRREDVLSVTVSAVEDDLPRADGDETLSRLWGDVVAAGELPNCRPLASRLIRERQATWDQSPDGAAMRPDALTACDNLVLAGDHVASRFPATLEAAVQSGVAAAERVALSR